MLIFGPVTHHGCAEIFNNKYYLIINKLINNKQIINELYLIPLVSVEINNECKYIMHDCIENTNKIISIIF